MADTLKEPFLRPNPKNQGTLPDGKESVYECPDIWFAGDTPIADFQKKLAEDYSKTPEAQYVRGHDNYIYLRMKNGSDKEIRDMSAKLYYAPAAVINWPSEWKAVAVEDHGKETDYPNSFDTVAAGAVGVVKAPFVLERDLAVDGHYCFLAQIYSDAYPNPKPPVNSPIGIATMLKEHLLWGQHNITKIGGGDVPKVDMAINMTVPAESAGEGVLWLLSLHTENAKGFEVELRNSRTDDAGKQIKLDRQTLESDDQDIPIPGRFVLKKGYSSQLSIYIYYPEDHSITENEKFVLDMGYIVNNNELAQAKELNILSNAYDNASVNGDEGVIHVGQFTVCLKA